MSAEIYEEDYTASQAVLTTQAHDLFEGGSSLEMQRRLLAKTKTDKVNHLLKKSK